MARESSASLVSRLTIENQVFNSGVPSAPVYSYQTTTDLLGYQKRSDIVRTPKGEFRAPLPYESHGYHKESAYIDVDSFTLANAGRRQRVSKVFGTKVSEGFGLETSLPTRLITAQMRERLLVDLLNDVGDQKWSLGQALAEAKGAVSVIGDAAKTIARALDCASKKNWKGVAKSLKVGEVKLKNNARDTASGWIQYSFAWVPLVEDIAYSALLLGGHLDDEKFLIMARAAINRNQLKEIPWTGTILTGTDSIVFNGTETINNSSDLKMSLYFEVARDNLRDLAEVGVVGLSTPWAILPHSYLVDWVLPIGDILGALDASIGLTYLGGSYTHFDQRSAVRKKTRVSSAKGVLRKGEIFWNEAGNYQMDRYVYETNPVPLPIYYKNPLDPWKAVMSIALLTQFSTSRP